MDRSPYSQRYLHYFNGYQPDLFEPPVTADPAIQIGYASSVEVAMDIMLDAAKKRQQILTDPEPVVFFKEFADSGINLELIIWVENPEGGALRLRSGLNLEIWSEFRKTRHRDSVPAAGSAAGAAKPNWKINGGNLTADSRIH